MKKTLATALLMVLSVTLLNQAQVAKADSTDPVRFNLGVTVFSPVNTTYASQTIVLNLTFGYGLGVKTTLNYTLDDTAAQPINLTAKTPGELHFINPTYAVIELPPLQSGEHQLTINVLSGIYSYHGANPLRAPFAPAYPGSSDYIAEWTHTIYFAVDSPDQHAVPSPSPTVAPTPTTTPQQTTQQTMPPVPSTSPPPSLSPNPKQPMTATPSPDIPEFSPLVVLALIVAVTLLIFFTKMRPKPA